MKQTDLDEKRKREGGQEGGREKEKKKGVSE